MGWLSRLLGAKEAAAPAPAAAPSLPAAAAAAPAPAALAVAAGGEPAAWALLGWLIDFPPPLAQPRAPGEAALLEAVDQVLGAAEIPDSLLPRATAFVPQLMAMLRQGDASVAAIAERVSQDAPLAAEVLRSATTVARGNTGPVQDLAQAVQRIGAAGVQQAVARVVFRPMYAAGAAGSLGARAAPRLWQHAERTSELAAAAARDGGLSAFDGYLAGLLHGTGWTIALRVIDKAGSPPALPPTAEFALALTERAHRLFGLAADRWRITPGFEALAADARQVALERSTLPLAASLRSALALRMRELEPGAPG
jgi:hypothetical protein